MNIFSAFLFTLSSIIVPLQAVVGTSGEPRLATSITIGAEREQVLVDTGSGGLRILSKALKAESTHRTGRTATGRYASGVRIQGEEALASLSFAGLGADKVPIQLVDNYSWPTGSPAMPEMFGQLFPGILGIDLFRDPQTTCCTTPLPALANGVGTRYIVHASLQSPQLILNPDDSLVQKFTMTDARMDGWPGGCVHVDQLIDNFCGSVIFDTGTPYIVIAGRFDKTGWVKPLLVAHLQIGAWSDDFTASRRMPIAVRQTQGGSFIIIGLTALQGIDVLFDSTHNQIGLRTL